MMRKLDLQQHTKLPKLKNISLALLLSASMHLHAASINFDIPAQPLDQSIKALAKQSGESIAVSADITESINAPALKGSYSVQEALQALLKETGLTLKKTSAGYTVVKAIEGKAETLPEVSVNAGADALNRELLKPYAGGQVATGGSVGFLGNRNIFETPFSVTNFTQQTIINQQATRLEDVLKGEPGVRVANAQTGYAQDFVIRGYRVTGNATLIDGVPGMLTQYGTLFLQGVERVEVFKGANAMLAGNAAGLSIGGTINLVSKRATDAPITTLTSSYASNSTFGAAVDVGRRFGPDNQFGVRFNGYKSGGDTAVDNERDNLQNLVLALDFRGEKARTYIDINKYSQHSRASIPSIYPNTGVGIPPTISSTRNFQQPFTFSNTDNENFRVKGEYDITDNLMAYATYGASDIQYKQFLSYGILKNTAGDIDESFQHGSGKEYYRTYSVGMIGKATTGAIDHQFALTSNKNWSDSYGKYFFNMGVDTQAVVTSNIYNPTRGIAKAPLTFVPYGDLPKSFRNVQYSTAIADTLSIFDKRLQITLGVRRQSLLSRPYDEHAYTPAVAASAQVFSGVYLYGNYIESLEGGPTSPTDGSADNPGKVFPPSKDKQKEVGIKVNLGKLGFTTAIYEIKQPSGFVDPATRLFGLNGYQLNRGLEFNVFGQPLDNVRLNGGFALTQAKLDKTENGTFDGKDAVGVAKNNIVLNGEWDLPYITGLTLTGFVQRSGEVNMNRENTLHMRAFTDTTLGMRYVTALSNHPLAIRASVNNVFDKDYWIADVYGGFYQGQPRALRLSATIDF